MDHTFGFSPTKEVDKRKKSREMSAPDKTNKYVNRLSTKGQNPVGVFIAGNADTIHVPKDKIKEKVLKHKRTQSAMIKTEEAKKRDNSVAAISDRSLGLRSVVSLHSIDSHNFVMPRCMKSATPKMP